MEKSKMKLIREMIEKALQELGLGGVEYGVEHPKDESHGDYSSNVAMTIFSKSQIPNSKSQIKYKSPRELAEEIVEKLHHYTITPLHQSIEKVEVAGAGFINFYLKQEFFVEESKKATKAGYGRNKDLKGQRTFVEYTDPNPFKEFHIGHLMSNTIGESLARILEANGAEVRRANYQGDVGLHVAKSVWGMQQKMTEQKISLSDLQGLALKERQQFMGQAYALGAAKYEADEAAKAEMQALNKSIYDALAETTGPACAGRPARTVLAGVMEMYRAGREWSLEYFKTIYGRLGTKFDEYFFESEAGPVGLKVVEEGLDKGVLEIGEEGAVIFAGEKYGLHTRVFRNRLGLPTYEAKDLGLAKTKWERWQYDRSYIITANEIDEYFKVLLKTLSLLYPELATKTTHLSHGMMKLTSGKMSSRTGKVITGEGLLDELKKVVLAKMGTRELEHKDKVADQVAVAALKYSVLKQAIGGDIVYEPEKMTNLEGDTGPYIQYTCVRAYSVLNKFQIPNNKLQTILNLKFDALDLQSQELALLRWIYRYPEVVEEAGEHFAPHLVATYIYELAQRFNTFYQACRVETEGEVNELRYLLTQASANVLKSGLNLLGIEAPEEM